MFELFMRYFYVWPFRFISLPFFRLIRCFNFVFSCACILSPCGCVLCVAVIPFQRTLTVSKQHTPFPPSFPLRPPQPWYLDFYVLLRKGVSTCRVEVCVPTLYNSKSSIIIMLFHVCVSNGTALMIAVCAILA